LNRQLCCSALLLLTGCAVALIVAGCAEIGRPPGGEVDRTGPSLMASYPPVGALNVPSDNKIILEFSEALVKPSGAPAVYLSPRPAAPPNIKVKGRRIEITLSEFFAPNQTYVVNVGSELADVRSNRLSTPVAVAFSTGPVIDSGVVSGVVLDGDKPAAQILMGLYRPSSDTVLPDFDSIYPQYAVTTNKDGRFELKYLPDGDYVLVGFRDKNKDERFNPAKEQYCLPDRPIVAGGELSLTDLNLPLSTPDTLPVQLISAAATEDNLVRVRLTKPISLTLLGRRPELIVLVPLAQPADSIRAQGFRESAEAQSGELAAWFGRLAKGAYRLAITYDSTLPPVVWDSLNIEPREVTAKPDIVAFQPGVNPVFVSDVKMAMRFTEPIDVTALTSETFTLWDDTDARIPLRVNWTDPFHASFTPEELVAGKKYRLLAAEQEIKDVDGQTIGDSLRTFAFSTLDSDSLGSISGEALVRLPDRAGSPVVLTFKAVGSTASFDHTVPGATPDAAAASSRRTFAVDLPAGKYLLTAFVDQNDDGVRSTGTIAPFRYSETFASCPDTVIVRARFETAGITLDIK
jgi:hypothetical protein